MHPERMILLFNVTRRNAIHVRHSGNDCLFNFHHLRRAIPNGCRSRRVTKLYHLVGFYQLSIIHFAAKPAFNRIGIGGKGITGKLDATRKASG